jgi:hypothetical protein
VPHVVGPVSIQAKGNSHAGTTRGVSGDARAGDHRAQSSPRQHLRLRDDARTRRGDFVGTDGRGRARAHRAGQGREIFLGRSRHQRVRDAARRMHAPWGAPHLRRGDDRLSRGPGRCAGALRHSSGSHHARQGDRRRAAGRRVRRTARPHGPGGAVPTRAARPGDARGVRGAQARPVEDRRPPSRPRGDPRGQLRPAHLPGAGAEDRPTARGVHPRRGVRGRGPQDDSAVQRACPDRHRSGPAGQAGSGRA